MIKKFKMKNGEIIECNCKEVQETKAFVVKRPCGVYKTESRYICAVHDYYDNIDVVIDEKKKLKDIVTEIDPEDPICIKNRLGYEELVSCRGIKSVCGAPDAYKFEIGNEVTHGKIIGRTDNYLYYYVKREGKNGTFEYTVFHWSEMFLKNNTSEMNIKECPVRYYNSSVTAIIHKVFHFGLDMNPDYQRGNVWTEQQRVNLIDSIFKHVPGAVCVVLAEKKWIDNSNICDDMEEVVDGKQRITTIIDFISGKFKYRGHYFHELNKIDRIKFEEAPVMIGEINFGGEHYNRKTVLETFIMLNTGGTFMDSEVIDNAKNLLNLEK